MWSVFVNVILNIFKLGSIVLGYFGLGYFSIFNFIFNIIAIGLIVVGVNMWLNFVISSFSLISYAVVGKLLFNIYNDYIISTINLGSFASFVINFIYIIFNINLSFYYYF